MLELFLTHLAAAHIGYWVGILLDQSISLLFEQTSQRFLKKRTKTYHSIGTEDRISLLSDDLIVQILLLIPTKEAVATMILSKRWQFIWTMVPKLIYEEINHTPKIVIDGLLGRLLNRLFGKSDDKQKQCRFIDKSLQLHKAFVLNTLHIEFSPQSNIDVYVEIWITNAVYRKVRELTLMLNWSKEFTILPKSLYTCNTLVSLGLSGDIFIDVPSSICFASLKGLGLRSVVYKDENSLFRLLSSCHILTHLIVERHYQDNVKNFCIKVQSLECLSYNNYELGEGDGGTLVIDSPALKRLFITDYSTDSCLIENKTRLNKALIQVLFYPDNKFMRSLSSVMHLELALCFTSILWFNTINFTQIMECKIILQHELDCLEPMMVLLQKCPNLKVFYIDLTCSGFEKLPLSWNQPSCVLECLSTHLEIFELKGYAGRSEEKEFVKYIFANSKCLKRAGISMKSTCKRKDRNKMMKELEYFPRVSTSSELLFSIQLETINIYNEMSDF